MIDRVQVHAELGKIVYPVANVSNKTRVLRSGSTEPDPVVADLLAISRCTWTRKNGGRSWALEDTARYLQRKS